MTTIGPKIINYMTTTATYTIDETTDYMIICNPATDININLPLASATAGQVFIIKCKNASFNVNITASTTTDVDGTDVKTSPITLVNFDSRTIMSNGTKYLII